MRIADIADQIQEELISSEELQSRIAQVAHEISRDYADVEDLLLIGVLKGAMHTMVTLSNALTINVAMDFMSLSSYGRGTSSSGVITVRQDLSTDVRGRHILIVEDIIDSGRTLDWLIRELKDRGAASVDVFALLTKPARREIDVPVRYEGFEIPDKFVVGYGLDYDELYRNLDSIAVLKPEVYQGE